MLKKKIPSLQTLVIRVYWTLLNIFPYWISKLYIRKYKNHTKASNGAEKFAQNLWSYKKSWYNVQNRKSGRHNQGHTFRRRKPKVNPSQPPFNLMVWELKEWILERLNLHLLVDKIKCKMFPFGNLQELDQLFNLLMNQTHVIIVYSWIKNIMIDYIFSIKLILIPICLTLCF